MVVVNERAQDYGGRAARYELQLQLITAINDPKMTIEQLQRITNDYPVSGDVSSDYPVSGGDVSSDYPVSGDVSSDYLVSGGVGNIGAYYQFSSRTCNRVLRTCTCVSAAVPFFGRVVRIRCI